jgi:hypothetical protein
LATDLTRSVNAWDDNEKVVFKHLLLQGGTMKKIIAIILGSIGLILAVVAVVLSAIHPTGVTPTGAVLSTSFYTILAMLGLAVGLLGVIIALPKDPQ